MRRTKFPKKYHYQKLQKCICEDCKREVYDWWLSLIRKLAQEEDEKSFRLMLDELPFPIPEDREFKIFTPLTDDKKLKEKQEKGFFDKR